MTMAPFAKILSWRVPGNFPVFIALAFSTGLSGCATLSSYEQSFAPSHPVTPPRASAALRDAEARGYQEGLAAGQRIQARRDRALAQGEQAKAATAASAMAQEAVEETQSMQALNKVCAGPEPSAKPAPVTANSTAAVKTPPPELFAPSGPARPLGASSDPF